MLNFVYLAAICFLAAILFLNFWLQVVKIYFHVKFRPSSSKIECVMLNFVLWRPFCFFDGHFVFYSINSCGRSRSTCMQNFMLLASKLRKLCLILFYGGHFVFWQPFCFLLRKQLWAVKIYLHAKFCASSTKFCASSFKIEEVMLNFVLWQPFCVFLAAILFFTP